MAEILECLRDALRARPARLPSLPRRHRPHRHGGRLPARGAGPRRGGGAGGAQSPLAPERALGAVAGRCPRPHEQTEYVRGWTRAPHARGRPAAASDDARRGPWPARALPGRAARVLRSGDAVAAATQYGRPGRFAPVGDMLGGGPFDLPRGGWSDDTAMALCLAESLLEREGFDARDQVARYRRWQQRGLSVGDRPVRRHHRGHRPGAGARPVAPAAFLRLARSGGAGPGAALARRAGRDVLLRPRRTVAAEQAAEAARTTCQAPAVLDACRALARALHAALSGQPKAGTPRRPRGGSEPAAAARDPISAAAWADGVRRAIRPPQRSRRRRKSLRAQRIFARPCWLLRTSAATRTWWRAVCGALAGAHYGVRAIPAAWRNSLLQRDLIEGCADRLLAHALLELGA